MWRKVAAGTAATLTLAGTGVFAADKAIDPYEDKGTHYELDIKADIEQGERVEIAKDKAAMTLKGWNDEYAITITPQIPATPGTFGAEDRSFKTKADRPLLSKKIEYREGDVTAFIKPREETENEFDIDFTLHTKPATNVYEYRIEGADNFDFFYQPPENGREEYVVGSYAVYHKTKANHRLGATNYATGKIAHIYRPKAIDANNFEIWADLHYSDGILSVTVPQEFLEQATYPVIVDPTFGYTTLGATAETGAWYANGIVNISRQVGRAFALSENARLDSITISVDADSSETLDMSAAVYSEDSAGAGSHDRIALSQKSSVSVSTTQRFETFTASLETLSAGTYIIAGTADEADLAGVEEVRPMKDTGASGNTYAETNASYATLIAEDPWTEDATALTDVYSMYATYTCTGEGSTCTNVFDSTGYTTWTVPDGVTQAIIACWGAGGGGGDGNGSGGGGGGGGAFASTTQSVSPSDVIRLFIGTGGISNNTAGNGTNGATTTASTTAPSTIVSAAPGWGGGGALTGCSGNICFAGRGGAVASSTGTTIFAGGNGGTGEGGTGDEGGGGGGAAGPHGAGANGATGIGLTTGGVGGTGDNSSGGAGGNGGNGGAGTNGTPSINGGGGGGGGDDGAAGGSGAIYGAGGGGGEGNTSSITGASGACTITYTIASSAPAPTEDDTTFEIITHLFRPVFNTLARF